MDDVDDDDDDGDDDDDDDDDDEEEEEENVDDGDDDPAAADDDNEMMAKRVIMKTITIGVIENDSITLILSSFILFFLSLLQLFLWCWLLMVVALSSVTRTLPFHQVGMTGGSSSGLICEDYLLRSHPNLIQTSTLQQSLGKEHIWMHLGTNVNKRQYWRSKELELEYNRIRCTKPLPGLLRWQSSAYHSCSCNKIK